MQTAWESVPGVVTARVVKATHEYVNVNVHIYMYV